MTGEERQALREKHREQISERPLYDWHYCHYCEVDYPCDVIKVLDALEEANFQAAINYERGYDNGWKACNDQWKETMTAEERQALTERDIESKILAVIHAYDETPESKLARIWQILGEKA